MAESSSPQSKRRRMTTTKVLHSLAWGVPLLMAATILNLDRTVESWKNHHQQRLGNDNYSSDSVRHRRSESGENPEVATTDPTSLRRGVAQFLAERRRTQGSDDAWYVLGHYQSHHFQDKRYSRVVLNANAVCHNESGMGWEGSYDAYRLLTQKIQVISATTTTTKAKTNASSFPIPPAPRLLCMIYTHSEQFHLTRALALTWGIQCDGFLAFSNITRPELGMIQVPHQGDEAYGNMWQKTRSIWKHVYDKNYMNDYDAFYLCGDDVYAIVPNLRQYAATLLYTASSTMTMTTRPLLAGQWIRQKKRPYVSGGPGYLLNRAAVHQYVGQSKYYDNCFANVTHSAEDRLLSKCLEYAGVELADTRDADGEQRFHDQSPQAVYEGRPPPPEDTDQPEIQRQRRRASFHARAMEYWQSLPPPNTNYSRTIGGSVPVWQATSQQQQHSLGERNIPIVGPRWDLQAAARDSVSFHKIHHPEFMTRMHAILYADKICVSS